MTKKILAVSLALCVMFAASSAFAQPRRQMRQMPPREYSYGQESMMYQPAPFERNFGREHRRDFGGRDFYARFSPDMPKEIRAMMTEAAKLRIDLDEALYANPVEKEKAFEIHDKIMKLEQDVERWKFVKKVDRLEKLREQREERRQKKMNQSKPSEAEAKTESK